jgi:hypothetical protein
MTITKTTPSAYDTGHGMVATLIEEACRQAGIPASRIDTSLVGYAITGVVYTGETYAERINTLLQAFKINAIDVGDRLAFVPRTAETTLAIAEDDLGARLQGAEPNGGGSLITIVKAPDSAAPRQVSVSHISRGRDYQASAQVSKRQSTGSVRHEEMSLAVGLDDQQAQWLADAELRERALEGVRIELALPPRYLRVTEGDVLSVPYRGRTFTVRVFEIQWDGVVTVRGVLHDVTSYTRTASHEGGVFESPPAPSLAALAELMFLDIPVLRNSDLDDGGFYLAVARRSDAWQGVAVYRSLDGATAGLTRIDAFPLDMIGGEAVTALAVGPTDRWDVHNSVRVRLNTGDALTPAPSRAAVLNGANMMLIGEEIVQFRDAIDEGGNEWTLSELLRGRRGTEWAAGLHAAGERVVLFSGTGRIHRHALPRPGAASLFKAAPPLYDLSEIGAVTFASTGAGLKPFSVCHVVATPDSPAAGDLTVTWVRRTRALHDWTDYSDAPLAEASEAYEVDVLAAPGGAGAVVLATCSTATPTLTLTAAQLAALYGAASATVWLAITQMSAAIGRGAVTYHQQTL